MSVKYSPFGNSQIQDASGNPAVGWTIGTYTAGSSARLATYTDATGATAQTADIVLNALGLPTNGWIWLTAGLSYKFIVKNAAGVTQFTVDGISGVNDTGAATVSQWQSSGLTPTFVSTTSFTVPGDQTTELHVKRKLQFTTGTGTVYGEILTTAFTTLTTVTMTMAGAGVLDVGLSVVNVSILRNDHIAVPGGVPTLAANTFTADQVINGVRAGVGAGDNTTNTTFGKSALAANLTGVNNVAIGLNALTANLTGGSNTAVGASALAANTTSGGQTAIGLEALSVLVNGVANTAVGSRAGKTLISGSNNTLIGESAAPSATTISNEVTLGNSSVATLRCQVTSITALSDARDKADIAPLAAGLDFVQRLKPVSYIWNMRDGGKVGIPDTGFIAQELKQVQVDTGIDIPGLVYEENPEKLEAAYGKLLPVMVKAIQELSDQVAALKSQLNPSI